MAKEIYRIEIPIIATDEYTDVIRKAEKEIKKLISGSKKEKIRIDADTKSVEQAEKKVNQLQKTMRKKGDMQISLRDNVSKGLQSVQRGWSRLQSSRTAQLAINANDRATAVIRGVLRTAASLPSMISVGIGVVGASKAVGALKGYVGGAMKSAMDWEVNEVAMIHRLNNDKKSGKHWMKEIGMLADDTPYSSPDLIPAFTQGLTLSKRDPAKAFEYTKIAADMAALTPGRTPEDAISALLGASMGNYAMLEAYGFKITQETAKQMGGFEGVFKAVVDEYQGGAAKLSQTNSGIISTLQGYQGALKRSFGQGLLAPLGIELQKIGKYIDNNQEGWGKIKDTVSAVGLGIGTHIVGGLKGTGSYVTGLTNILTKGINIKRDEDTGAILNADEVGKQALENLKATKDKVLNDLSGWWDTTGKTKAVEIGTAFGEGAIDALIAGVPLLVSALGGAVKESVSNAIKNPSAGSIGGAALAVGGVGYLGGKVGGKAFRGGKSVINTSKKAAEWGGRGLDMMRGVRAGKYRADKKRKVTNTLGEMQQAKKYSQTPQAYRPPPNAKSKLGVTAASKSTGLGKLGRGAGNVLKGAGGKIPGLNLLFGAYDATMGWKDASNIMGKANNELTFLDKSAASAAKVVEGFSFGLIRAEKTVDLFTGGKSAERRNMLQGQPDELATGITKSPASQSLPPNLETPNLQINTTALQSNIDMLTQYYAEANGWTVAAFHPLQSKGTVLAHNMDLMIQSTAQSVIGLQQFLAPLQGDLLAQNINALSINLAQASIDIVGAFYPLQADGALVSQNMNALSINLAQASIATVTTFSPMQASGSLVNHNLQALAGYTAQATVQMSSFSGISASVASVKSALSGLANRIRSVPTPSISGNVGGPVKAYAKGGIATSPHIGLVAEAGVPESMIPHDGSQRSKDLWTTTGHALGMFDTSTAHNTTSSAKSATGNVAFDLTTELTVIKSDNVENIIDQAQSAIAKAIWQVIDTTA